MLVCYCLMQGVVESDMLVCYCLMQGVVESDMLVCTVGELAVWPGASNVIPGSAEFSVDIRSKSDTLRNQARNHTHAHVHVHTHQHNLAQLHNIPRQHTPHQRVPDQHTPHHYTSTRHLPQQITIFIHMIHWITYSHHCVCLALFSLSFAVPCSALLWFPSPWILLHHLIVVLPHHSFVIITTAPRSIITTVLPAWGLPPSLLPCAHTPRPPSRSSTT